MNYEKILIIDNVNYLVNELPILSNITFDIFQGDFISIVGPNGAGKTTLFKLLLKVISPASGSIVFANSINNKDIGYVSQVKTLDKKFPAIALELVCTGIFGKWQFIINKKIKNIALDTLELINAKHLAYKQISQLSGGELQRVYLARALVRKPKILLLDEPATGIDFICEKDITSIITRLNEIDKTTIIMITHDWSAAYQHSQKVLLLNKKIIYCGNPAEAFTDKHIAMTFGNNQNHQHDVQIGIKNVL